MEEYVWLLNPHGMPVEVPKEREAELLARGYVKTEKPKQINRPKIPVDCALVTLNYHPYEGYGRMHQLFRDYIQFNQGSKNKLILGYPHFIDKTPEEKIIYRTMFEADKIPQEWIKEANKARGIIVPSQWCKKVFVQSGVTVPIEIVPDGVDEFEVFNPPLDKFTFLHYDFTSFAHRKGGDLVLSVFLQLFGNNEKTQLILKGRDHKIEPVKPYPNVRYIFANYPRYKMIELFKNVHCFVFPSRGEGFGLPPLEAMAHGVPTIVTNAHSTAEFAHLGIPLKTIGKIPAAYEGWSGYGQWVQPDPVHLAELMMDVYQNYQRYKTQAVKNQSIVKQRYNFEKVAHQMVKSIREMVS